MVELARPWFFVHLMKTGGSTMREHIAATFDRTRRYPFHKLDPRGSYWQLAPVRAVAPERRPEIDLWAGHLPFFAAEELGIDGLHSLSVLRDPVARTLSHLAMEQRDNRPEQSLEAIYDDPVFFERFLHDPMTKVFSLRPDDGVSVWFDIVAMDDERLAAAKRNVASLTVVGVQERFDDLLATLADDWGWTIGTVESQRVAGPVDVDPAFRRRIEDDNRLDRELYEFALDQVRERARKMSRGPRS